MSTQPNKQQLSSRPAAKAGVGQPRRPGDKLHGAELVMERAFFYRDSFRKILRINLIMIFTVVALLALNATLVWMYAKKERSYFAMAANGTLLEMKPLSEPSVSENRMLQIVGDAATCVFTYDYVNFRDQLGLCKPRFSSDGWTKFTSELSQSKIINLVTNERLVLTATRINSPVLVDQGLINGVLAWKIEVPVRVTFTGRQSKTAEDYLVNITATRASQTDHPDGVAITSFVASRTGESK